MANKERGEVTLVLGGEKYTLRPEFGVIAEIEDELDTDMFRFGMKAEQFQFRVKELAQALKAVLKANGYQVDEKRLTKAITREGMAAVVLPLVAFVQAYVWGAQPEKKTRLRLRRQSKTQRQARRLHRRKPDRRPRPARLDSGHVLGRDAA